MLRKILYDLHYNNLVSSNLLSDWCGREQVHGHQHVILLAACQLHLLQSCLGSGIWWTPPNFASPNCKKFQSVAYLPTWFILFIYLFNSIYNFYLFLLEFICFFLFFFSREFCCLILTFHLHQLIEPKTHGIWHGVMLWVSEK